LKKKKAFWSCKNFGGKMGVLYLMTEGSSARKSGPRIVVEKNSEVIGRLPVRSIDGVVIGRNSQITTQAIFEILEQKISVCYVNDFGEILAQFCNEKQSASRLLRQLEIFRDAEKQIILSREIIQEKILNQCNLLKRYKKTVESPKLERAAEKIQRTAETVKNLSTVEEIRGAEGIASKNYFGVFAELFDKTQWKWKGRSQHPAQDSVNALLNYGYAYLEREVRISAAIFGFDARIGFFHSNDGRKDSLIFDLMELFRQPVIDRFVLSLINRRMIQPENFESEKNNFRLTLEGRRIFSTRYEEYISREYSEYGDKNTRDLINDRVRKFAEHINR